MLKSASNQNAVFRPFFLTYIGPVQSTSWNSASDVVAALFDLVDYIGAAFAVEIGKWQLQHRVLGGTVLIQWCLVGIRCSLLERFEVWL